VQKILLSLILKINRVVVASRQAKEAVCANILVDYEIASAGVSGMRKYIDSFERACLQAKVAFSAMLNIYPDLVFGKGEAIS